MFFDQFEFEGGAVGILADADGIEQVEVAPPEEGRLGAAADLVDLVHGLLRHDQMAGNDIGDRIERYGMGHGPHALGVFDKGGQVAVAVQAGGKVKEGETPQEALKREIREELATEIEVSSYIDTIEYDYPTFHLSMDCFACTVVSGKLELLEHENATWLSKETLYSVKWLPADITILGKIERLL